MVLLATSKCASRQCNPFTRGRMGEHNIGALMIYLGIFCLYKLRFQFSVAPMCSSVKQPKDVDPIKLYTLTPPHTHTHTYTHPPPPPPNHTPTQVLICYVLSMRSQHSALLAALHYALKTAFSLCNKLQLLGYQLH